MLFRKSLLYCKVVLPAFKHRADNQQWLSEFLLQSLDKRLVLYLKQDFTYPVLSSIVRTYSRIIISDFRCWHVHVVFHVDRPLWVKSISYILSFRQCTWLYTCSISFPFCVSLKVTQSISLPFDFTRHSYCPVSELFISFVTAFQLCVEFFYSEVWRRQARQKNGTKITLSYLKILRHVAVWY